MEEPGKVPHVEELSCMHLRLMKALCEYKTRRSRFLRSQRARTFENNFAMECIRLIGLNSLIEFASCFFGSRTMMALLRLSRFPPDKEYRL